MSEKCPVCNSSELDTSYICRCGYNYEKNIIEDKEKTITYYNNLKKTEPWIEAAKFTFRIHVFQQKKKGVTKPGARGGWGYRQTAKLLGEKSVSTVNDSVNLAAYSAISPDLLNCENRKKAKQLCKNLSVGIFSNSIGICDYEDELQKYLEMHWDKTSFAEAWELKGSQVDAGYKKRIDLLAHHRIEDCWLVIELKSDKTSNETVGQILRYMGWIKTNRANKDGNVKGLIISGWPPDKDLWYSLLCAPNIDQQIYYRSKGKKEIEFMDAELAYKIHDIEKLPIKQQIEKFKSLNDE